jgi:exonuclease SbcC
LIRRIEIQNLISYGDIPAVVYFTNGKNVIIGENATGKSALLFAIELAFLGSVSGWSLGEVVNDKANEGKVTIDFVHHQTGTEFQIARCIKRSNDSERGFQSEVTLTNLDTGETVASSVASMESSLAHLNIDKSVFSAIVNIRQGEIDRILTSSTEQRLMLDRLLGIEDLRKAYDEIGGKSGSKYTGILREIEHKKDIERAKIEEKERDLASFPTLRGILRQIKSEINEYSESRNKLSSELMKIQEMWTMIETINHELGEVENSLQTLRISYESSRSSFNQICARVEQVFGKHTLSGAKIKVPIDVGSIDQLEAFLKKKANEIKVYEKDFTKLLAERDTLAGKLKEREIEERIDNARIREMENQIERIGAFLETNQDSPNIACELCGTVVSIENYNSHIDKIRTLIESQTKTQKHQIQRIKEIQNSLANVNEEMDRYQLVISQRSLIEESLESLKKTANDVEKWKLKLREKENEIEIVLKRAGALLGRKTNKDELGEITESVSRDLILIPEKISNNNKLVETKKEELKRINNQIREIGRTKKEIAHLEEIVHNYEQKLEVLSTIVRPSFQDIQPLIRRRFLNEINDKAMEYFDRLYASASKYKRTDIAKIWVDDEYRFWVERQGQPKATSKISGGQRIVVSLCFLFAFLDYLGSGLGFLLLDEPSTHLDEKRIEELVAVLQELQNIPQIIIVDHREELIQSADITYKTTLDDNHSTISQV